MMKFRSHNLALGDKAFYVLFAATLALVLLTFRDYGYSWDEVWQNRWYGQAVLRFLATFGQEARATTENDLYLYGGTFDALAELLVYVSPFEPRNTRHLANALAGLAGLWGCRQTARLVGGPTIGFWAALFLIVCAPWYGHMFINAKDIPFAAGYIWSLYFLLRSAAHFPAPPWKDRVLLGLALGLTLGVRIGGLLLILYAVMLGLAEVAALLRRKQPWCELARWWGKFAVAGTSVLLLAWLLMAAFWPAALLQPLAVPWEAFQAANHFQWDANVLWHGRLVSAVALPWNYLPLVFAVQLPEVLVLIAVPAIIISFCLFSRALKSGSASTARGLGLLIVAALFPVVWAIVNRSTMYDNGRHFLFVLPPLMALIAYGWVWLLALVSARMALAKPALQAIMLACLLAVAVRMVGLHPYQYAFFNIFAGGMPAAAEQYDTDYWVTSYREATLAMLAHARKVAETTGRPFEAIDFSVLIVAPSDTLREVLPENFTVCDVYKECKATPPDYFITTPRWHADSLMPDWPVLATVERLGMPFAVVKVSPDLARLIPAAGGR